MSLAVVLTLASAAAFLALGLLAAIRGGKSALAAQLGLMCLVMSTYNALDAVAIHTQDARFDWLASGAAALLSVPTWHVLVGFVGMGRRLRWAGRLVAAYFAAVAISCLAPFARPELAAYPGSARWAQAMLVGVVPAFASATYLVARHARRASAQERARCQLLVGAVALGVGGNAVDLALIADQSALRLAVVPMLASAGLIAGLVLEAPLFERVSALTIANVAVLALAALLAHVLVFRWAGTQTALAVFGSLVVVLALLAAVRPQLAALAEQRARARYLTNLGRFAEQMAHDIRNPLAAIRGAAQFLQKEAADGRPLEPHVEFVDLIIERAERLERVVRDYQRMGRVEPVRASVDLNELVEDVVGSARTLAGARDSAPVAVDVRLAPDLPAVSADRDLLAYALENLVKNAREAMPDGGKLFVGTERGEADGHEAVVLVVRDTGKGMSVRDRERALEEFFTTKSEGSGLGLPFVARVAEAHGGELVIDSEEGAGTKVTLALPAAPSAA